MIKALIFDMDGTLVDSERVHWQAWHDTLQVYAMKVPEFSDFGRYVGVSDEQMALDFTASGGAGVSPAQLVAEKRAAYLTLVPQINMVAGVREIISRYQGRYRMAVASSSPYDELIAILEHHRLQEYFEDVVGGDMVAKKKPDPEIYLSVTARLGLSPHECVAFEDSGSGVAAAKRAGLAAVAVPHTMSLNHDFSEADIRLESLLEVDDLLLARLAQAAGQGRLAKSDPVINPPGAADRE